MKILMLGHSLIEFFDWEGRFHEHRVVNLGVAGETVEGLLGRLKHITMNHPGADLIFIMTGANNIAMEDYDFFAPYGKIIDSLKRSYPDANIYIHSVLPILLDWVSGSSIEAVNRSIKELAADREVEFIDIHNDFTTDGQVITDYLLDDGVHLSNEGYEVWSSVIDRIIMDMKDGERDQSAH
jgi:lysophospholipase L1-like esterase